MCQDAHTIDLDDEVVADPSALIGGTIFDHALMEFWFYFEADDLALLHYATGGDVADEEGLLTLVAGILGRPRAVYLLEEVGGAAAGVDGERRAAVLEFGVGGVVVAPAVAEDSLAEAAVESGSVGTRERKAKAASRAGEVGIGGERRDGVVDAEFEEVKDDKK